MKQRIAILVGLPFFLGACAMFSSTPPTAVPPTATATDQPALATPTPTHTATPLPSSTPTETPLPTPIPTKTPLPTATFTPTIEPVSVAKFEAALLKDGYHREPFKGIGNYTDLRPGIVGYIYIKDNVYEPIKVYTDGYVRLEVINDPKARAASMERKFALLDTIFPEDFMAELRQANDAYLETAPRSVTGEAAKIWPPAAKDFWRSIEGQYNLTTTKIAPYDVGFSLWFWQITCPEGYICWLTSFPGEVFIGQNSLVFYNIEIYLPPR